MRAAGRVAVPVIFRLSAALRRASEHANGCGRGNELPQQFQPLCPQDRVDHAGRVVTRPVQPGDNGLSWRAVLRFALWLAAYVVLGLLLAIFVQSLGNWLFS